MFLEVTRMFGANEFSFGGREDRLRRNVWILHGGHGEAILLAVDRDFGFESGGLLGGGRSNLEFECFLLRFARG